MKRPARFRPLGCELLESRRQCANLAITDISLTDSDGASVTTPDEGTNVNVVIHFTTNALPAGGYVVRRSFNGSTYDASLNWGSGSPGTGTWTAIWGLGAIRAGDNDVTITLDAAGAIAETSEADNSATINLTVAETPWPKLITPLGGVPLRDWRVNNYVDLDPSAAVVDYRGNPFSYNGHDAHDIDLAASWQEQESGVPIYASAGGKVTYSTDGDGDKCGHPTANDCGPDGNGVVIDHGGGWQTTYWHMRKGTVAVTQGQTVVPGQFLGFVGSSGNSTGPHLHWAVYHNGVAVEPDQLGSLLLADPLPYRGEAPSILELYTAPSGADFTTRQEREVFSLSESPIAWMVTEGILPGTSFDVVWYRPNGAEYARYHTTNGAYAVTSLWYTLSSDTGEWRVATEVNGSVVAETRFERTALARPEIKVTSLGTNFNQVANGSTTPVNFDPAMPGTVGSTRTITVRNVGNSTLTTGGLRIPAGFTLEEGLSPSIASGDEDTFTIRLDSAAAGVKSGDVSFTTNDADEGTFTFPIRGEVATLSLSLSSTTVGEQAGANASTGTVTRPANLTANAWTVYLASSDRTEAAVPIRVTIPAGQQSTTFPVAAVPDDWQDGTKSVQISASLLGNVSASATLNVVDQLGLTLSVAPASVSESAGANAAIGTVTRTGTSGALVVRLSSLDTSEATVPATVTILNGQSSASFAVAAVNDPLVDGVQTVGLRATAAGYADGTTTLQVTDDDVAGAYHNSRAGLRSDVDEDGSVDAQDVLWTIYFYDRFPDGNIPATLPQGVPLRKVDVTNNNLIEPDDILFAIVDYIAAGSGEGEAAVQMEPAADGGLEMLLAVDLLDARKKTRPDPASPLR